MKTTPNQLSRALTEFLADQMPRLRGMSPHTIRSYRDCMVLLLRHLSKIKKRPVSKLTIEDIDVCRVISFLDHLEESRKNSVSTRNVRLAAIHAFFRFLAGKQPDQLEHCQKILAVPFKRSQSRPIEYLEYGEIQAVLAAVERTTPDGRRDYVLLATLFNTGARVQEIIDVRPRDLQLVKPAHVRLYGKGKKERLCPLWPQTAKLLEGLLTEQNQDRQSADKVFHNHCQQPITRFGVRYILRKYCDRARKDVQTLVKKRLHPHSMRHSTAVHLLKAGVDMVTISQWLGHASISTTNRYASVDLDMKREAIAKITPKKDMLHSAAKWRGNGSLLKWLESL